MVSKVNELVVRIMNIEISKFTWWINKVKLFELCGLSSKLSKMNARLYTRNETLSLIIRRGCRIKDLKQLVWLVKMFIR